MVGMCWGCGGMFCSLGPSWLSEEFAAPAANTATPPAGGGRYTHIYSSTHTHTHTHTHFHNYCVCVHISHSSRGQVCSVTTVIPPPLSVIPRPLVKELQFSECTHLSPLSEEEGAGVPPFPPPKTGHKETFQHWARWR